MENKKLRENLERSGKMPAEKNETVYFEAFLCWGQMPFQIYFISSLKYLKIARTPLFRARKSFEGVSWEWVLLNSYDAQAAAQQGRIHPALLQQGPLPHSCKWRNIVST